MRAKKSKFAIKTESLFEPVSTSRVQENDKNTTGYVIELGENKFGKMIYLSFYSDCDDFAPSAIPSIGSKDKINIILKKAIEYYKNFDRNSFKKNCEFTPKIVPAQAAFTLKIID